MHKRCTWVGQDIYTNFSGLSSGSGTAEASSPICVPSHSLAAGPLHSAPLSMTKQAGEAKLLPLPPAGFPDACGCTRVQSAHHPRHRTGGSWAAACCLPSMLLMLLQQGESDSPEAAATSPPVRRAERVAPLSPVTVLLLPCPILLSGDSKLPMIAPFYPARSQDCLTATNTFFFLLGASARAAAPMIFTAC